jgi:hypothetical protein
MVFINPIMTTHVNRTVDQPLMSSMVTPKRVVFKYSDFKKDVDPDAHVRVFNYVVKKMQRLLKNISLMCLIIH